MLCPHDDLHRGTTGDLGRRAIPEFHPSPRLCKLVGALTGEDNKRCRFYRRA